MKIDQVAFGLSTKSAWDRFAAKAEVIDEVTFDGWFCATSTGYKQKIVSKIGYLAFDYETGFEREYLFYPEPAMTFHSLIPGRSEIFLSHLASHVDSIDYYLANGGRDIRDSVVMDVLTTEHKSEKLRELGRTYRYIIMDWRQTHGYFYKLIQRIEKPGSAT